MRRACRKSESASALKQRGAGKVRSNNGLAPYWQFSKRVSGGLCGYTFSARIFRMADSC